MTAPRRRSSRTGLLLLAVLLLFALLLVGVVFWGYSINRQVPPPTTAPPTSVTRTAVEVFFTTPRYPDRPSERSGGLDERLVAFLRTATTSIDMAIYELDLSNVTQELLEAHRRGVRVRVVTDSDSLEDSSESEAFQELQRAGITVVGDQRSPIMHHKFAVVDRAAVWMGSWNFTVNDTYRYNNNAALWHNEQLAQNYAAEFDKMVAGQFGPTKPKAIPYPVVTVNEARVETYFASETDPSPAIIKRLQDAQRSITFMAYSFTHDGIGQAMLDRHQRGVVVRGVFENTGSETRFSEYGRFKQAGLDVVQDGNPYLMHHKVIIIDERTVVFGSFNFSANAAEANDENCLIVDDPTLAAQFLAEYQRVRAQADNPPARR